MKPITIPFSAACERNKEVIHTAIAPYLEEAVSLLEIGSGTGQHAVYLASQMPHLQWQTSDQAEYLEGVSAQGLSLGPEAPIGHIAQVTA